MKLFYTLVLLLLVFSVQSQYRWCVGLKANDNYGGANFKGFLTESDAIDVTIHVGASGGRGLVVLYKRQQCFRKSKEAYWFYGGGSQVGFWRNNTA